MGIAPELVSGAIRVSIGPTTSEHEIAFVVEAWISSFEAYLGIRLALLLDPNPKRLSP